MLLQLDPFSAFIQGLIAFLIIWAPLIPYLLMVIAIWMILFVLNSIIGRYFRRRAVRVGLPPDAVNGLILAMRLILLWIGVVAFAALLPSLWGVASAIVGGASVIIGLAVGIAIGQAMQNFFAGIYVIFSDPFDVGDYVRIGVNEGIVLEVSINYTKLRQFDGSITLIPNDTVMKSSVTNFRFDRKRKPLDQVEEMTTESASIPRRILKVISKVIDTSKLIQYTLELSFSVDTKQEKYEAVFSKVCKKWKRKLGYEPVYALTSISHVAYTYSFTLFVDDPQVLLEHRSDFVADIANAIN